ncbi:MAG: TetR family transcriptional regulator [Myxococcales bacterium]|nr:TetR family transcriptional regulator [Myxococcales bacterium]
MRTRAALVAAAAAEFAEAGYAAATARSIAARAAAATGSFYQYFTCKDEVLRELAGARQDALIDRALGLVEAGEAQLAPDVRARLRAVIDAVIDYHAADAGLHAVITERRHADPGLDALITAGERRLLERIAAVLGRWGHAGDPTATAFILLATLEGAVHAHVLGHPVVDDRRFVDALAEALLRIALPSSPLPPENLSWPSST